MDQLIRSVIDVLQELRIDLQDFAWLIAQQLRIDSLLVNASDQVFFILQKGEIGNQRSLIRKIAFKLPIKPLPRVHFTIVNPDYAASFDWDTNSIGDEGLASIPILDNHGKIEFWNKKMKNKTSSIADSEHVPYEDDVPSIRSASPPSICADSLYSSQSTVDTMAMTKISALEDELARLREQIAKIVTVSTVQPGTSDYGSMPPTPIPPPPPPPFSVIGPPPPPPPPMSMSLLPPPPPPPPPHSIIGNEETTPIRKLSLAESLQSKSLKSTNATPNEKIARTTSVPSMTDVLKDMGKVKLKKVDRSIQGTPVRSRPDKDDIDPATMIALALRKRFAQMNQISDSPERESREDRDDSFSESTENLFNSPTTPSLKPTFTKPRPPPSPRKLFVYTRPEAVSTGDKESGTIQPVSFGQHMLRKTGQRS